MSHLLSLQQDFLKSFRHGSSFEDNIIVNGPSPQNRLSIYHNNIVQALINCLSIAYPLTWKLIGEDCAKGAAHTYIHTEKRLPLEGNLYEWGEDFPNFLTKYKPTQKLAYLSDFARLEWLMHLSYSAEDQRPLTGEDFKDIKPEQFESLLLMLHPSAHLFSSTQPLDQVMAVLDDEVEGITLEKRGSYALVVRPLRKVNVHWISETSFTLYSQLQKGDTLIEALEKISLEGFQFHEFLSFSLKNGVFSNYAFKS